MDLAKKNVGILATCQALLFTNNTAVIAINALAGLTLATNKAFATLPVTAWVVGAASISFFASMLMRRYGRRVGFTVGCGLGLVGTTIAGTAIVVQSFWLLCLGTLIFGAFNGFGTYLRFAAADAASAEFKPKAISLVLAGGLVGGLIGPQLSTLSIDWFATRFLGVYVAMFLLITLMACVVQLIDIPKPTAAELAGPQRPLPELMRQPKFIVAVASGALGYGVMNLLMTATPLEMTAVCGHPYSATAWVIGSHVVGMFGPSFFTGSLIKRFGVLNVMAAGVLLNFLCIGIALAGITVAHFWFSLVILGIGWNFLYIGGTTLLTECYRPAERAKAQGTNDSLIFLTMVSSSFASGFLLNSNGWAVLNYLATVIMLINGLALVWLMGMKSSR